MRKFLKWTGIVLLSLTGLLIVAGIGIWLFVHENPPEAEASQKADERAKRMLSAIDHEAWDSTAFIRWTFSGPHHFLWDKERDRLEVRWKDDRALLLLDEGPKGLAYSNDTLLEGDKAQAKVKRAWSFFCNDEFWLNGPAKAFDRGVKHKIPKEEHEKDGLLMHFTQGGVTPGDKYLWILDEEGKPEKVRMWVSILPVGGLSATWSDWKTLSTGAKVATKRQFLNFSIRIDSLKGGMELSDVTDRNGVFKALEEHKDGLFHVEREE